MAKASSRKGKQAAASVPLEPRWVKYAESVPVEPVWLERPPSQAEVDRRVMWLASLRARFGDAAIAAYSSRCVGAACLPDPFTGARKDWRRRATAFHDGLQDSLLTNRSMYVPAEPAGPVEPGIYYRVVVGPVEPVEPGIYYQVVETPATPLRAEPICCKCKPHCGDEPGIGPCHYAYPNGVELCRFGPVDCKYCHHPHHFEGRLWPPTRRSKKTANHP